jgi:hypothetical protein
MVPSDRCPVAPDLKELTTSITLLVQKTDNLISLNRDIIRWLLVVVCVIALGRSAFDATKEIFKVTQGYAQIK